MLTRPWFWFGFWFVLLLAYLTPALYNFFIKGRVLIIRAKDDVPHSLNENACRPFGTQLDGWQCEDMEVIQEWGVLVLSCSHKEAKKAWFPPLSRRDPSEDKWHNDKIMLLYVKVYSSSV